MIDLARLNADAERALVLRADGGNNADPPPEHREKPRVSAVISLDPLAISLYMAGAPKAPTDVSFAANTQTGQAMEDLILAVLERAIAEQIPGFEWDRFLQPDTGHGDIYGWQPDEKWDCGPAVGRPDAVSVEHGIIADAKSASASQFAMKVKDGGKDFAIQQTLYLAGAEKRYGKPFTGLVMMMNKETKKGTPQAFATFRYAPDPAILQRVVEAVEASRNGATCPYKKGKDWQPSYCVYRNQPGCGGA